MIIKKIILENFRQFKGRQSVNFLNDQGDKNVTVILGDNGRGKTSIFRALMYCLYGTRKLAQDEDIESDEIHLINIDALKENSPDSVTMSVTVEFEHEDVYYELTRSMEGFFDEKNDKFFEQDNEVKLKFTEPSGNTKVLDNKQEINEAVNSVLDKRIREFFLFDGEKIEHLTRAGRSQRKEIKKGIRNLLDIDVLESALETMKKLTKSLESEAKKRSPDKLHVLLNRRETLEEERDEKINSKKIKEDESIKANEELLELNERLEEFREIKDLIEKRKTLEERLSEERNRKNQIVSDMRHWFADISMLLLNEDVKKTFERIDKQKKKGEIPSQIRAELIEKILEEHKCICGREIDESSDSYKKIMEWKNKTDTYEHQEKLLDLWRYLSEIINQSENHERMLNKLICEYVNIRNEIDSIQQMLDNISDQIGGSYREDISHLESQRDKVNKDILGINVNIRELSKKIEDLNNEIESVSKQIEEEERNDSICKEIMKRAELARKTQEALDSIYKDFTNEAKDILSKTATKLLNKLLDSQSKIYLKKIVVKDGYSLEVLNRFDQEFLANISAGQRQIISIAFIAALAQAASKGDKINYPLFMDTPFGRLSLEHRLNLIKEIPNLCSQWIMLTTGTEFTKKEADTLISEGKWLNFYHLVPTQDGNTLIRRYDPKNAMNILKGSEELA